MLQRGAPIPALVCMQIYGDCAGLTFYRRKAGNIVWHLVAYPDTPASPAQIINRNRFRLVASDWHALTPEEQHQWHFMATKPHTWLTGYTMFTAAELNPPMRVFLPTLQRQAGLLSIPPFTPR